MGRRSLRFRYHEGSSLSAGILREIWKIRVEMLDLNRPPDEDWRYFRAFVQRDDTAVFAFQDKQSVMQGFFTISYIPIEHDDRKGLLFFSKYFYFRRDYRGHYKSVLAPWVLLPIALRRYGLRSLHFVAATYPQSFVSLSRTAGNVHALGSNAISDWEKVALTRFVRRFYGDDFDQGAGVLRSQNVVDTPSLPQSEEARALSEEYDRLNPDWRQGNTLPVIFAVNAGMIRNVAARTLRRVLTR